MIMNRKEAIENGKKNLIAMFQNSTAFSGRIENASGIEQAITTLTSIRAKVTEQKFYTVPPSDFMPVVVGQNAFMDEEIVWTESFIGEDFESGVSDPNSNNGKSSVADGKLDAIIVKRKYWDRAINYNVFEVERAARAGNWSAIESKERSRFKSWQLGIQKVAFIGLANDDDIKGLLTQTTVNSNTTTIPKFLKNMNATEFQDFLGSFLGDHFTNSNSTVYADTFIIPTDDFNGLASAVDETFNLKSRLQRIREACVEITGNADFKVAPLAYAQKAQNPDAVNRYVLYRRNDDTTMYMDIPVDYITTTQDTVNGFNYESIGYGQFSGCNLLRPLEVLYFDHVL